MRRGARKKVVSKAGAVTCETQVSGWLEGQRDAVVAIAQARWLGAVLEHMALMAAAACAVIFRTRDEQFKIPLLANGAGDVIEERRPARTAVEFIFGFEKVIAAACAGIDAVALFIIQIAGKRPLRRFLAQHRIGFRRQTFFPFLVGQLPFVIVRNVVGLGHFLVLIISRGAAAGGECCNARAGEEKIRRSSMLVISFYTPGFDTGFMRPEAPIPITMARGAGNPLHDWL